MPARPELTHQQREMLRLLAEPEPRSIPQIARCMGISRGRAYELHKRLGKLGLVSADLAEGSTWAAEAPQETVGNPGHAPVRVVHVPLTDGGQILVQAPLLPRADGKHLPDALPDERVVVVRWVPGVTHRAFVASRRHRWSIEATLVALYGQLPPANWAPPDYIEPLTRAIAKALKVEAILVMPDEIAPQQQVCA